MAFPPLPSDSKIFEVFEALFDLGQAACNAIQEFQPDLVIGLAHSGWIPVPVSRAVWEATQSLPFPPSLRINLGLEKSGLFRDRRKAAGWGDFNANYSDAFPIAPLLVWVGDQLTWQDELREMVAGAIGANTTPGRILVLDEMVSEGDTYLMTFSLLHTVYPDAALRFLAGWKTWSNELADLWLAENHPTLERETLLKEDPRGMRKEGLKRIVVGTEDVALNSLRWRFISEATPAVQSLGEVIPMPDLLACSTWVEARVCQYAMQRASGLISEPATKKNDPSRMPHFRSIWPDLPPFRQLWQEGRITARRWSEIRGCSLETAEHEIQTLINPGEYLVPRGPGDPGCYLPCLLGDFDEPNFVHPLLDVYWAIPGQLLVGPSPAARDVSRIAERLTWLADTGVTRIIDLTESADNLPTYDQHLNGGTIQCHPFPIERFRAEGDERMRQIIAQLNEWIDGDETVYLCDLNGAERAGMVLACLFIEQGMTAPQALEKVDLLRFQSQRTPVLRCPESQEQWQRVIRWEKR